MFNKDEIKSILSDILECPTEEITDEIPLSDLGYDSLKFISTVVEIESKYDIEVLDSDLLPDNFKDVSSICETLRKYFADKQKLYKCVITDCDGVLWRGISGESSDESAYIDESTDNFCKLLHDLRGKGVLLAICSKNERANIDAMLFGIPVSPDDFAIIEADTPDKSDSISYILNEFGFSADNAVYIDDSDAEIEYVKNKIPEITVLKADYSGNLTERLSAMFSSLPESNAIDRTSKFREQKEREKVHRNTSSPEEYNRILETKILCNKAVKGDASRLSELSQRANRFNLTGARYTEDEIVNILINKSYSIYKLCAEDKFGDMGLVAMAVVHDNIISSFIMSCRVFGRGFEKELLEKIKSVNSDGIIGLYHPTGKNDYCKDFYKDNGVSYELR